MRAKFHCCGTTPSQSAYELFSPPLWTATVQVRFTLIGAFRRPGKERLNAPKDQWFIFPLVSKVGDYLLYIPQR